MRRANKFLERQKRKAQAQQQTAQEVAKIEKNNAFLAFGLTSHSKKIRRRYATGTQQ